MLTLEEALESLRIHIRKEKAKQYTDEERGEREYRRILFWLTARTKPSANEFALDQAVAWNVIDERWHILATTGDKPCQQHSL